MTGAIGRRYPVRMQLLAGRSIFTTSVAVLQFALAACGPRGSTELDGSRVDAIQRKLPSVVRLVGVCWRDEFELADVECSVAVGQGSDEPRFRLRDGAATPEGEFENRSVHAWIDTTEMDAIGRPAASRLQGRWYSDVMRSDPTTGVDISFAVGLAAELDAGLVVPGDPASPVFLHRGRAVAPDGTPATDGWWGAIQSRRYLLPCVEEDPGPEALLTIARNDGTALGICLLPVRGGAVLVRDAEWSRVGSVRCRVADELSREPVALEWTAVNGIRGSVVVPAGEREFLIRWLPAGALSLSASTPSGGTRVGSLSLVEGRIGDVDLRPNPPADWRRVECTFRMESRGHFPERMSARLIEFGAEDTSLDELDWSAAGVCESRDAFLSRSFLLPRAGRYRLTIWTDPLIALSGIPECIDSSVQSIEIVGLDARGAFRPWAQVTDLSGRPLVSRMRYRLVVDDANAECSGLSGPGIARPPAGLLDPASTEGTDGDELNSLLALPEVVPADSMLLVVQSEQREFDPLLLYGPDLEALRGSSEEAPRLLRAKKPPTGCVLRCLDERGHSLANLELRTDGRFASRTDAHGLVRIGTAELHSRMQCTGYRFDLGDEGLSSTLDLSLFEAGEVCDVRLLPEAPHPK